MKEVIKEFLKGGRETGSQCDADDMKEVASIILGNNYFEFDGKFYRQRIGMAIGTKFALVFANIFMS